MSWYYEIIKDMNLRNIWIF